MTVTLPIKIEIDGDQFDRAEIKKPNGKTLADAYDTVENKGWIAALQIIIQGSIESFINDTQEINNETKIIAACRNIYWKNAEALMIKTMAMINDGWVQGIYNCSFCGREIMVRESSGNSIRYIDLPIKKMYEDKEDEKNINKTFELKEPIIFYNKDTGDILLQISSITLRPVKLQDMMAATRMVSAAKKSQVDYATLALSIIDVDTQPVDMKWIKTWGVMIFNKMGYDDLEQISLAKNEGGIQKTIELQCPGCGEIMQADIDTNTFFQSGLRKRF